MSRGELDNKKSGPPNHDVDGPRERNEAMEILAQDDGNSCSCSEGKYTDKSGQVVPTNLNAHSCQYIALRNSLLPRAESFANSKVPEDPGGRLWSRAFNQRMKKLMEQANGNGEAGDNSQN
jgi:hypothetical protein